MAVMEAPTKPTGRCEAAPWCEEPATHVLIMPGEHTTFRMAVCAHHATFAIAGWTVEKLS